jgi:FimV-like protein
MSGWRGRAAGVALALTLFGAAVALQVVRDRIYSREQAQNRAFLYVQSPAALRRIALSFDALAADVYWIRALQHYGGDRLSRDGRQRYQLLYPLLDLTTSLDPYFTIAYRFGAIFLSEGYPGGPGRPDLAVALLKKGISSQPDNWRYYHDIAFVHYWQFQDTRTAAEWFRLARTQPDAPTWLEPVAASMLIEGGDRESARIVLQQILNSPEPWLQQMARRSLLQLDALDFLDRSIRPVIARNPPPPGTPYSWQWLVGRGAFPGIPIDPANVPFEIDPATGTVSVSPRSPLFPMPRIGSPQ